MLQKLREHSSGWIAKIILFLLVVVFSFWGIESYFVAQTDTSIATVGGEQIQEQVFQDEINQLRQQQGQDPQSGLQAEDFEKPEFRRQVLDRIINRSLLQQANRELGVTVTDQMVRAEIAAIPAFQIQGDFDPATYQAILGQQGMSPAGFQQQVRDDLAMRVIPQAVTSTTLVTEADVNAYIRLSGQKRDLHYLRLPTVLPDPEAVSDAEIQAYFDAHRDDYMTAETVSIRYLELKAADLGTEEVPGDADIAERYEREKSRFEVPEQREVAHILVSVSPNATPEEQKAALARADDIKARLDAGADFGKLAEEESDDLGSRRQGGDLGWIEPGMTDEAFNDAAFGMAAGSVSAPVLSSEGYHIISVREIRTGHTRPLAEVRDELVHEMLDSAREREFNEVASRLVDLTYQDPNSLDTAANALGLTVQTAGPFPRTGGAGIAANPDVVRMAFSPQVLSQGMTSDPVNIGSNEILVLRIDKHTPSTPMPLEEVSARVRTAVAAERANEAAQEQADAMLARLRGGEALASLLTGEDAPEVQEETGVERFPARLPPAVMDELFRMPHPAAGQPVHAAASSGGGSYTLIQLDAVHPGDPATVSADERRMLEAQLRQLGGNMELSGMLAAMRTSAKVSVQEDKLLVRDVE